MTENTNPSRIKEVQILNENGAPVGGKVKISPDAVDVMVHDASKQSTHHVSLQDFLFAKFDEAEVSVGGVPMVIRKVSQDANGEKVYFTVDPSSHSMWQGWYDHLDMTKKRLAGLYTEDGYSKADFLLGQENDNENDIQAQYTLIDTIDDGVVNNNIKMVIAHYPGIQDHKDGTGEIKYDAKQSFYSVDQDLYIKNEAGQFQNIGQGFYIKNEEDYDVISPIYTLGPVTGLEDAYIPIKECALYTDITMSSLIEQDLYIRGASGYEKMPEDAYVLILSQRKEIPYTAEEKAKELMFSFGEKSFWQALIDSKLDAKDKLIGIYDNNGNCVGHFEATRYNIDALKEVYKTGFNVGTGAAPDENNDIKIITWGQIETDEEAMGLLIDLSKKSIYQHLIELKDFWITLPFEEYETGIGNNYGLNIVNKNDILSLHFADNTLSEETTEEVE